MADFLNELRKRMIVTLQCSLRQIRQLLGFGVQEFGDVIGLTRQTINNLETGRTPMSQTQYVAVAAVVDNCIKNQPELLGTVSALLALHARGEEDGAFDMIEGGALLNKWFLSFPMGTRISELHGAGLGVDGDFYRIADTCKVFLDDTILTDGNFYRGVDEIAKAMAERGNRFFIPLKATELLQERLFSPNTKERLTAREGLKFLVRLQNEGLVDIRGERDDTTVSDTLRSVFARFKNNHRLALITQNSDLARQIFCLNDEDPAGFPILLFHYDAKEGLTDWKEEEIRDTAMGDGILVDAETPIKQFCGWDEII